MKLKFAIIAIISLANVCLAKVCYVDSAATGARDGTSWANAWTHPSHMVGVGSGDTVYVSGGTSSKKYMFNDYWNPPDGSSGNPLVIANGRDAGHTGLVVFESAVPLQTTLYGLRWVKFDFWHNNTQRLEFKGPSTTGCNVLDDDNSVGFTLLGAVLNWRIRMYSADYLELGDRTFNSEGRKLSGGPGWVIGIGTNVSGAYSKNKIHHCTFKLFYLRTPDQYGDNGDDGIQNVGSIDIYNNNFISLVTTGSAGANHQDAIQTGYGFVRIFNNYFENISNYAIFIEYYGGGHSLRVFNNIINYTDPQLTANPTCGIAIGERYPKECSDILVSNNLVRGGNRGIAIGGGYWGEPDHYVDTHAVNNVFYQGGGITVQPGPGGSITNTNNVTAKSGDFVNVSPQGATPGPGNDFHYTSSATDLINKGTSFPAAYPQAAFDKDGVPRPQSGAWDVGPHEYGGSRRAQRQRRCLHPCPRLRPRPRRHLCCR